MNVCVVSSVASVLPRVCDRCTVSRGGVASTELLSSIRLAAHTTAGQAHDCDDALDAERRSQGKLSTHAMHSNFFLQARCGTVRDHVLLLCNLFLGLGLDAYVVIGKVYTSPHSAATASTRQRGVDSWISVPVARARRALLRSWHGA